MNADSGPVLPCRRRRRFKRPSFPFSRGLQQPGRPEAPAGNVKVTSGGLYAPDRGLPVAVIPQPNGLLCLRADPASGIERPGRSNTVRGSSAPAVGNGAAAMAVASQRRHSRPPSLRSRAARARSTEISKENPSHMGRGLYRMVPNPALCWSEAATRSVGKFFAGAEDQAGNADPATQPTATDLGANPVCLGPRDVPTWMAPAEHLDRVAPANPGRRARGRSHCGAGRRLEGALTSLRRRCRSPGRGRSGSRGLCDWGGCRLDGPPLPASRASARRAAR